MGLDPWAGCNFNISQENCTLTTCCLAQSPFTYLPSYSGNIFFAIYFAFFTVPQLALGIYYKTWGYMIGMICGLALEVVGYAMRVALHKDPFHSGPFLTYVVCITIAPVFISAAIYLCLTRIVIVYGENNSRFRPRTIAITFMTSDFVSLVMQALGGAMTNTPSSQRTGTDIMIAGLLLQVLSLVVFLALMGDFTRRCSRGLLDADATKYDLRHRSFFKAFLASLVLSATVILIRSIYRVAELWQGFGGQLWNNETDFMVLDGAMIALATLSLTIFHPEFAFAGHWGAMNWSFRKGGRAKQNNLELQSKKGSTHTSSKLPAYSVS